MSQLLAVLAAFFASLIAACPAASQEKVTLSHSARASLSIGPLLYGIQRGFYRDEGIDLIYLSVRADLGIKAMLAGEVDYIYSVGTAIRAAILGVPVRCLGFDFSKVTHFLMGRPEIKTAAALRGKKIGVSSFGATGDLATRASLQALGIDPLRDVTLVTLGSDTTRYAALQAGVVQATHIPIPLNIQMRKEGFNELFYAGKILQRPLTGIAATNDKIRKNPQQVQRMLRAFVRASRALKSERGEFISFAQKKFGYSRDVTEEAYGYLVDALSHEGLVDDSVLQSAIDESKSVVNVSKAISRNDVVDYSFLKQAQKQ